MFLKILIFKILYFLKLGLIFVGSVHNFGRSDDDKFSEKMLISTRCIHGFMSNLIKKSWTLIRSGPPSLTETEITIIGIHTGIMSDFAIHKSRPSRYITNIYTTIGVALKR